jgi:hypothetical protein
VISDPLTNAPVEDALLALHRARERLRGAVHACEADAASAAAADPSADGVAAVRSAPEAALEAAVRHYATCARGASVPPDEFVAEFESLFGGAGGARAERLQTRERWYRALHWAVFTYVARDRS